MTSSRAVSFKPAHMLAFFLARLRDSTLTTFPNRSLSTRACRFESSTAPQGSSSTDRVRVPKEHPSPLGSLPLKSGVGSRTDAARLNPTPFGRTVGSDSRRWLMAFVIANLVSEQKTPPVSMPAPLIASTRRRTRRTTKPVLTSMRLHSSTSIPSSASIVAPACRSARSPRFLRWRPARKVEALHGAKRELRPGRQIHTRSVRQAQRGEVGSARLCRYRNAVGAWR